MGKFHTPLRVMHIDKKLWQLEAPLAYESERIGNTIIVPQGFITDFASVPRLPLAFLMTGGKANKAAVVHDWLYSTQKFTREIADDVFYEAVLADGHSKMTAWLMWTGVRLGGWKPWGEKNLPQPPHIELP